MKKSVSSTRKRVWDCHMCLWLCSISVKNFGISSSPIIFQNGLSIMKLFSVKMWSVNIPLNKRIINFINAQDRPNLRMCRNLQFDSRVNWIVGFSSREIHFVSCLSKVFVIPNILQNALCFWYHGFHFYCQNDVDFYYRVLLSESSLFVYVCVCIQLYVCVCVCVCSYVHVWCKILYIFFENVNLPLCTCACNYRVLPRYILIKFSNSGSLLLIPELFC